MNKLLIAQILILLLACTSAYELGEEQPYQRRHHHHGHSQKTEYYITPSVPTGFRAQSNNYWHQLENLSKEIELQNDQMVDISYGLNCEAADKNGHIVTGLTIDGASKNEFVRISGNKQFLHTHARNKVFFTAGTHTITVLYRTPHPILGAFNTDWRWAYLKIIF